MIWSHATKSHVLGSNLHSGTSKTKAAQGGLARVALFWKSYCATFVPACVILFHVSGSCKRPITLVYGFTAVCDWLNSLNGK